VANFFMSWRTAPPEEWEPMPSGLLGPVRLIEVGEVGEVGDAGTP
jgi:hypothetical protein